jgi:CRP-like cAMP-binding protein
MAGVSVWLGFTTSLHTTLQQSHGELVRVPAPAFIDAVRSCEHAQRLLHGYAAYSYRFVSQACVCNTHHAVKQRLCRWLLSCADRDRCNELELPQALLADMMGVRRQSVSEVLADMHRAGTIEQGRSHIVLLERAQLERCACECYQVMKGFYARLVEPLL